MGSIFKLLATLAGVFILVVVVVTGCTMITTPINTARNVVTKTLDADNVIYNYEWFHSTYNSVTAIKEKIRIAKKNLNQFREQAGARNIWTFEDKQQDSFLQTIVQGLEQNCEGIIADYNAKSNMINRKIFRGTSLPEQLEAGSCG